MDGGSVEIRYSCTNNEKKSKMYASTRPSSSSEDYC